MEVLTDENINPSFKRVKYGIRGWLEDRTYEIKHELENVSVIYLTEWQLNETFRFISMVSSILNLFSGS